jgi:hypothetical protein
MHAVAVNALINQRMLLVEMQRREEQTKPGRRDQKAPCSFFVLQSKLKEEETSSPARHYTNVLYVKSGNLYKATQSQLSIDSILPFGPELLASRSSFSF